MITTSGKCPDKEGNMGDNQKLIHAINKHTEDMDAKELEMVLRFIHSLKEFR